MEKTLFWRIVLTLIIIGFFINGIYRLIFPSQFTIFGFSILILSEFMALTLIGNIRIKPGFISKKNIKTFVAPLIFLGVIFWFCQINLAYLLSRFMDHVDSQLIYIVFSYLGWGIILLLCLLLPKINFKEFQKNI